MSSFFNFKRSKAVQKAATTPVAPAPERFPLAGPMPFPASDKAERKVYLFVHQDMQLRFFDRNRICIGKNRDDVFYSDTQLAGTIIMLSYDAPNTTWGFTIMRTEPTPRCIFHPFPPGEILRSHMTVRI